MLLASDEVYLEHTGGQEFHFPFLHTRVLSPWMVNPRLQWKRAFVPSSLRTTLPLTGFLSGEHSVLSTR